MRRRFILTAAILAACLFFVTDAHAGCTPGEGDCPLEPPQSEEVNPDPDAGGGLVAGEVGQPGGAVPVMLAMPLPRVVPVRAVQGAMPPAPVSQLPVPMRYQDPADGSDVSCGVQALGMALEGLGGSAPTSASMTDQLGRAGMLYEYGTGVEELAFAAQSFGYAGSLPFHDATLVDLRSQLDLGHPVVVALGTGGEGQPGHFVTATGISADGLWISVNDPAFGPRTLPIDEFLRLWDQQGKSGVFVAQDPPLAPGGDPIDAMPWVALMAGVMALVSTTPWGSMRRGVGGRADAGGGGGGKKPAPAPKPAPKAAPKPAPKPAPAPAYKPAPAPAPKPATAPAPRARFDEEPPAPAPTPIPPSAPAPKPALSAAPAPRARFDDEPLPQLSNPSPAVSTPAPKQQSAGSVSIPAPRARFDDEPPAAPSAPRFDTEPDPPPPPAVTATPTLTPTLAATATPAPATDNTTTTPTPSSLPRARFDEETLSTQAPCPNPGGTESSLPAMTREFVPLPVSTPPASSTSAMSSYMQRTAVPSVSGLPALPDDIERFLLTSSLVEGSSRSPILDVGVVEIGEQRSWHAGVPGNPAARISPERFSIQVMGAAIQGTWEGESVQIGLRTPKETYALGDSGVVVEVGQSASLGIEWDGWNTTTRAAYNPMDFTIRGGPVYGAGKYGVYVEEQPIQVVVAFETARLIIGAAVLLPSILPSLENLLRGRMIPDPALGG